MSEPLIDIYQLMLDNEQPKAKIAETQALQDKQVADWKAARAIMMSQMQEIGRGVSMLVRGIRLAAQATGTTLDPMQNALLGLVSSTATMITSTAVAMAAGSLGVLSGVALALASFAYSMQVASSAKIIHDFLTLKTTMILVQRQLRAIETSYRPGFVGRY